MAGGSIDEVAEFLASKRAANAGAEAPATTPNKVTEQNEDATASDALNENEEGVVEADENEEEIEEEEEDSSSLELSDEDLVEVLVDGEVVKVSLKDLKGAYSGEGAIQKRLQEATESRKAATATATKVLADGETARATILEVIKQMDDVLHKPTVAAPTAELRARNPAAFLDQLERYNQEKGKLEESRRALATAFQEHGKKLQEVRETARQTELQLLTDNFAPLRNEATRAVAAQDILDAVAHYGFSEEDMAQVIDHRLYIMAHDAAQYRKLLSKGKTQLGDLQAKVSAKPRTIRTIASHKVAVAAVAKQVNAVRDKAKATGRVDDVAAYLAASRNKRK